MTSILTLDAVNKSFGSFRVTRDVSFARGEARGIIGPNGAGKSTLFNLITGTLPVSSGAIAYDGADITRSPASARCRMGIARSFPIPHPFTGMTVYENLLARRPSEPILPPI